MRSTVGIPVVHGGEDVNLNFSDFLSPPRAVGPALLPSCFCMRRLNRSFPSTQALFVASLISAILLSGM